MDKAKQKQIHRHKLVAARGEGDEEMGKIGESD